MPIYSASTIPFSIAPGDVQQVWNAETPTPGERLRKLAREGTPEEQAYASRILRDLANQ